MMTVIVRMILVNRVAGKLPLGRAIPSPLPNPNSNPRSKWLNKIHHLVYLVLNLLKKNRILKAMRKNQKRKNM
jgi:hypothetical protein